MARSHTMTPARHAALRKAQLASARKRRKRGVGSSAKRAVRQGYQRRKAARQVRKYQAKRYAETMYTKRQRRVFQAAAIGHAALGGAIAVGAVASAVRGSKTKSKVRQKAIGR